MAVSDQEKSRERLRPFSTSVLPSIGPVSKWVIDEEISFTSNGSTKSAAFPATSGNEELFEAITGQPDAIASMTGNPNPSYNEG